MLKVTGHDSRTAPLVPIFWLMMATTTAARLYYFFLTAHQPVWWDEAEYLLKAKALVFGTPDTGFFAGRPPLFPIALSGVFAMGLGEITIRVLIVVASQAAVYLTYRIGRLLLDDLAGISGAWLLGLFYIDLFYTMRVMTEIPHLLLVLLGLQQLIEGGRFAALKAAIALALAMFIRYPAGLMFAVVLLYILSRDGPSAFRSREYYAAVGAALAVALPFLLSDYLRHGNPIASFTASGYLMPSMDAATRLDGLLWYWRWAKASIGFVIGAVVGAGLLLSGVNALLPRLSGRPITWSAEVLLLAWSAIPVLYFGLFVHHFEDRYIILALPPAFLAAGRVVVWGAEVFERYIPATRESLVAVLLLTASIPLLTTSNAALRGRVQSFAEVRDAGSWLMSRMAPGDRVWSKSVPQLTYYTSHAVTDLPDTLETFEANVRAGQVDYVALTAFEAHPGWVSRLRPETLGLSRVAVFPDIGAPTVIILARAKR